VLGDRRDVLAELAQVAEGNLNSPACATLLLGTRGMGKTTLLRVTEKTFATAGWHALRVTAEAEGGLIEDLEVRAGAPWHGIEHGDEARRDRARLSGVTVAGLGVTTERLPAPAPTLDLQDTLAPSATHTTAASPTWPVGASKLKRPPASANSSSTRASSPAADRGAWPSPTPRRGATPARSPKPRDGASPPTAVPPNPPHRSSPHYAGAPR